MKDLFDVKYLGNTWSYKGRRLFRAEKLYSPKNYQAFLTTFRKDFEHYVYYCPFRRKEIISAPLDTIEDIFVPRDCLRGLIQLENKDNLQKATLNLVDLLSTTSSIPLEDFGVHGSVALGMHTSNSDIDLVVYGSHNFRVLESTVTRLVEADRLKYRFSNRLDTVRRCKGRYLGQVFMYNAIRKPEEAKQRYGDLKYTAIAHVNFTCKVEDDGEAMFRPAIYKIKAYGPRDAVKSNKICVPQTVVSMIGCYRNVAHRGDTIRVAGTLERVENVETGHIFYQVVVGTGTREEEHIWPLQS